MSWRSGRER